MQPRLYWSRVLAAALRSPTVMPAAMPSPSPTDDAMPDAATPDTDTMEHTPAPLEVINHPLQLLSEQYCIAVLPDTGEVPLPDEREANAHHLAACYNYCEGTPTDALEIMLEAGDILPNLIEREQALTERITDLEVAWVEASYDVGERAVARDMQMYNLVRDVVQSWREGGLTREQESVALDVETWMDTLEGLSDTMSRRCRDEINTPEATSIRDTAESIDRDSNASRGVAGLTAAGGEVDELRKRVEQMESLLRNSCSALITQALMLKDRDPDDNAERIAYAKQSRRVREILRALDCDEDSNAALATEDTKAA